MTSITITPGAAIGSGAVTTRLRLTMRGRRVLLALAALPLAVALSLAALGGASAIASDASDAIALETVTVLPGDTLWALAGHIAPDTDPRIVVDELVRLNRLAGGEIYAGQRLAIPAQYSAVTQ